MNTILIVGFGNIGFRHFQSLNDTKKKLKIYVYDHDYSFFDSFINNQHFKINKKIYLEKLNKLKVNEVIDVCILSTDSNKRYFLCKQILNLKVKNIIFEKVVFQNPIHFKKIFKIAKKKRVKMYVNCPRRAMEIFKSIKRNEIKNSKKIYLKFIGNNWGICSNSIHFLDLINYFTEKKINFKIKDLLFNKIYSSKRRNYYELKGKIIFFHRNYQVILIDDNKIDESFFEINIDEGKKVLKFNSNKKNYVLTTIINGKLISKKKINFPLQSKMTIVQVDNLINKSNCDLTTLSDSYFYHKIILDFYKKKIEKILEKKVLNCPIT